MNAVHKVLFGFALMAGTLAAQNPSFTGVVNAGSNIPPGFPNSGLAQGSIFVVYGSNLGPSSLVQAGTLPLPTTAGLAGTSITITSGGTTVTAPIIYTSAGQVAAILPSTTPTGSASLTLTFNSTSGSTPITVVQSNFGIVTTNNSGAGPAVVTFGNYSAVTNTNTAKPGDTLILWGTGLGALPAGQSDAIGAQGPLANPPTIQVLVGGIPATIAYQARTPTATGLDQINFVVPPNAPLGCNVSIIVQTSAPATTVSNGPTISLAATDGATCSDATQIVPTSFLSKSSTKVTYVAVNQSSNLNFPNGPNGVPTTTTSGKATVGFLQFSQAQLTSQFSSFNREASFGSCYTGIVAGNGSGGGGPNATYLNGGSSVTLSPPGAPAITLSQMTQGSATIYQNQNVNGTLPGGPWAFSNTGGADVSAQFFGFSMPAQVTWTNAAQLSTGPSINRTQPLTILWSGGDSSGYVDIQGTAAIGTGSGNNFVAAYTYYFDCAAPTSASKFTIPPSVLLGIPAGPTAFASIQVSTYAIPSTGVTIPGFDALINTSQFQFNVGLSFK